MMPHGSATKGGTRKKCGRWMRQEHERFLAGLEAVGENWCLVATYVPTRTERQIRTHAQKYFRKVRQGLPFPEKPYDSSVESDNDGNDDDGGSDDGSTAVASNGESDPHAHLPVAGSRLGVPAAAPSFVGREFGQNSDSRNTIWNVGGGGYGGGAAPLHAPIATAPPWVSSYAPSPSGNLHGAWIQGGEPEHGAPGYPGQQQQQYHLPFQGQGSDMAGGRLSGGRFSPPEGVAAPFRNWPVADGERHANLLVEYGIGNMDGSNYHHDNVNYGDNGNDGAGAGASSAAAAPRLR